ncbi:unnamed protein product [marine sediment metagenome]|uniref:Uncharacterized protein n=1 Tax=marine sediment metagenome TaxID=412755 RepID=X1CXA2_9ZZZZ
MSEIPFAEIQKYISDNCPFKGMCFGEVNDPLCRYEIMDGFPCRYMPKLVMEFKEKYEKI